MAAGKVFSWIDTSFLIDPQVGEKRVNFLNIICHICIKENELSTGHIDFCSELHLNSGIIKGLPLSALLGIVW